MKKGAGVPIFFATLVTIGGGSTVWNNVTDHNEPPAHVIVQPVRAHHMPLWSPKPVKGPAAVGSKSGTTKLHLRLHGLHLHGLHHNRIGGYWSRRAFRGAFRGLFGGW
jgi:hypothetical protein